MIEQVGGGGGGGGEEGNVPLLLDELFRATIFLCRFYIDSPMPFLGRFYQYLQNFCCMLCIFHQKVKQCFGHKIVVMYN